MRIYGRSELNWKKDKLYLGTKYTKTFISSHDTYSKMYWVNTENGLSEDFYNLSRTKDHGITLTLQDFQYQDSL